MWILNIGCVFALQALLKKHEAFMSDLEAYRSVIEGLREQALSCKVSVPLPTKHWVATQNIISY